eukprot:CAMPEP_0185597934 /NCGR_PEP_ID=MMETSP0434-20130131/81679_1 /TAXON_ID=626734 ORGANISM="Favella taraikaensis, Strain Fe Narragansett Bay" /NCGR_SAMPLE_ID=MMETSP0434 /ASSEMBLY_ACC=CAM_ASM_000379 /LENGTH=56 /DNA_ID=CAMNT_0028226785 /DNA_START=1028 /DNA_END=1198 /DNA_ORIENTATION=-
MYIALSGSIQKEAGDASKVAEPVKSSIAPSVLGLNTIAAMCLSGVIVILKVNNEQS